MMEYVLKNKIEKTAEEILNELKEKDNVEYVVYDKDNYEQMVNDFTGNAWRIASYPCSNYVENSDRFYCVYGDVVDDLFNEGLESRINGQVDSRKETDEDFLLILNYLVNNYYLVKYENK